MKSDQKKVFVPSEPFSFPSYCSKCLRETDLTSYKNPIHFETVYKQDKIEIPICRSCKKKLRREARTSSLVAFVIGLVICGGGFYVLGLFLQQFLAIDWKFTIVFIVLIVSLPLFYAYGMIKPEAFLREQGINNADPQWPVKFEHFRPDEKLKGHNPKIYEIQRQQIVLSFENEDYAKLFVAAIPNLRIISLEQMGLSIDQHIRRLRHPSWQVRNKAAEALGKTKDPKAVEPLIQALRGDEKSNIRSTSADALARIGDARAIEALTQATEDKSLLVRISARRALKVLKSK